MDKIEAIKELLDSFTSHEFGPNGELDWFTVHDHLFLDEEFWPALFAILRD